MTEPAPGSLDDPVTFYPRRLRRVAVTFSISLCVASGMGWRLLPADLRSTFNASQVATLLLILAGMIFGMAALAASSVRADETGLRVRNGLRTHDIPWAEVHKILLRPGDPWALALIEPDDRPFEVDLDAEKRQLMGIQSSDGPAASAAVVELRRRHQAYRSGPTRSRGT